MPADGPRRPRRPPPLPHRRRAGRPDVAAELDAVISRVGRATQPAEATFHAAQADAHAGHDRCRRRRPCWPRRSTRRAATGSTDGDVRLPSTPFRLRLPGRPVPRWHPTRCAAGSGADGDDRDADARRPVRDVIATTRAPPLAGVRVLDLTAWQAGPMATMMLGDFGADVIKIEAPQRLDGWRGGAGLTVDRAYERNPLWNSINRGKLGLSLDLASDAGRELFLRLVADADVVVENFTPRVMGNLGLGVRRAAGGQPAARRWPRCPGSGRPGRGGTTSPSPSRPRRSPGLAYLTGAARRPAGPDRRVGHRRDGRARWARFADRRRPRAP